MLTLKWGKLRKEMKSLSDQIIILKNKRRSSELNNRKNYVKYMRVCAELKSISTRFTKLCVMRGLQTGKKHLSDKTDLRTWWPRPESLDEANLKVWVKPEFAEFMEVVIKKLD